MKMILGAFLTMAGLIAMAGAGGDCDGACGQSAIMMSISSACLFLCSTREKFVLTQPSQIRTLAAVPTPSKNGANMKLVIR